MLQYVPVDAKRVLDVGCAAGVFGAQVASTTEAEVWGIEIDPIAAAAAIDRLSNVINADVSTALAHLPKQYFDCVVFNDVLEHLSDPYSVLAQMKEHMASAGTLVCSVPNVRYFTVLYRLLVEKNWRYSDSGVMDKTHLRFFTIRSLAISLEQAGYKVVRIEGINATDSIAARTLRVASFGWLSDCIYPQIACVARPQN
jgi:2-polyprenyl-3-methyl-5-hydroxy-6-metoxy-1,4-benzoquinol methylase